MQHIQYDSKRRYLLRRCRTLQRRMRRYVARPRLAPTTSGYFNACFLDKYRRLVFSLQLLQVLAPWLQYVWRLKVAE